MLSILYQFYDNESVKPEYRNKRFDIRQPSEMYKLQTSTSCFRPPIMYRDLQNYTSYKGGPCENLVSIFIKYFRHTKELI